jgi:hypothetical protein
VFPSSGEGKETPTLLDPLERANLSHRLVIDVRSFLGTQQCFISLQSPEDGNRSGFRNVMFSSYLELRTVDIVHKPSDSECKIKVSKIVNSDQFTHSRVR